MDAPLVRYDYDGAEALEGRRWLLADERGSIYAHADEAGAIVQTNTYDEYGRPGDSNQGRFGYTGQIWLAEAGLYHYKARAYHAELGVFMQSDPIGHSGGINLYAYVGGDPVNYTDPWGVFGNPVNVPNQKCPSGTRPDSSGGCEAEDRVVVIGRRFESGGWGSGWNFGGSGGVYRQPKSQGGDSEREDDLCQQVTPLPNEASDFEQALLEAGARMESYRRDMNIGDRLIGASVFRNRLNGNYFIHNYAGYSLQSGQYGTGWHFPDGGIVPFTTERVANVVNSRNNTVTVSVRRDGWTQKTLTYSADLYVSDGRSYELVARGGTTDACH
jgi:RHS repeat-associated protein